jgi:hypothetical protein
MTLADKKTLQLENLKNKIFSYYSRMNRSIINFYDIFDTWKNDCHSCGNSIVLYSVKIRHTKLYTYLLTPWSRVLPEKLKRPELLKKFPAFYGTRRFIPAFTRARHLSLSTKLYNQPYVTCKSVCKHILKQDI